MSSNNNNNPICPSPKTVSFVYFRTLRSCGFAAISFHRKMWQSVATCGKRYGLCGKMRTLKQTLATCTRFLTLL